MSQYFSNKGPFSIGSLIGKGGEGNVYHLSEDPKYAVKIYKLSDLADREEKIMKMLEMKLSDPKGLVSFPIDIVRDHAGKFCGFIMPKVSNHKSLHELFGPRARKQHFPQAEYPFIIHTAANIARAIETVHASGCIIGDINPSGILISDAATAALIDVDSYQFVAQNKKFMCVVGTDNYTPPELQGLKFSEHDRTRNHDNFGLAVIIFQLLFQGRHPFSGEYFQGDMPINISIKENRFAYSQRRNVGMKPPPHVPLITDFPIAIRDAFEDAFDPSKIRPTPTQWITVIEALKASLHRCGKNQRHHYPATAKRCLWCEIDNSVGTELFPPIGTVRNQAPSVDQIFKEVDALFIVPMNFPQPMYTSSIQSIQNNTATGNGKIDSLLKSGAFAVVGIGLFFTGHPIAIFGGLVCLGFAYDTLTSNNQKNEIAKLQIELREIDKQLAAEIATWFQKSRLIELKQLEQKIQNLRKEIQQAPSQSDTLLSEMKKNRKDTALIQYLQTFFIKNAGVQSINDSLVATLASYGVETAADVKLKPHIKIPGIGPTRSQNLRMWVGNLEGKFRFNTSVDIEKHERDHVQKLINAHLQMLLGEFEMELKKIKTLNLETSRFVSKKDDGLQVLFQKRYECASNLASRNITVMPITVSNPVVSYFKFTIRPIALQMNGFATGANPANPPITNVNIRPSPTAAIPQSPKPTTLIMPPTCPQCQSQMQVKTARRGRRVGSNFWGCTKFPRCRGTRPI